jgi:hypothetical protein
MSASQGSPFLHALEDKAKYRNAEGQYVKVEEDPVCQQCGRTCVSQEQLETHRCIEPEAA